ncbi:MAG TPA: hypothetical protein VG052_06725, partial [Puia sp.]|nr:hypothetical protein [Puia sp.]
MLQNYVFSLRGEGKWLLRGIAERMRGWGSRGGGGRLRDVDREGVRSRGCTLLKIYGGCIYNLELLQLEWGGGKMGDKAERWGIRGERWEE